LAATEGLKMTIAIITARGGSKRIPRKNIKEFCGIPLISYSIKAALEANSISRIIVSTDDKEIAELALKYGAEVPFIRSEKNSDDYATTVDVVLEVLEQLECNGEIYEKCCCIYPTAPFITAKKIDEAFSILDRNAVDSVIPVSKFSYPIQRALKIEGNKLSMMWPENINVRSQDLETAYHDCGQFYWFRTDTIKKKKQIFTEKTMAYEIPESEVQDIDNMEDWKIAEIKYRSLNEI